MKFKEEKFELLSYEGNEDLKFYTNYLTPEADDMFEANNCLRDLGFMLTDDAKF